MKRIITLALLLCINSNIVLASDAATIKTIPISYEIAINNLQTKISNLEARRSMLAWLDHARKPWICFVTALMISSFAALVNDCHELLSAINSLSFSTNMILCPLLIIKIFTEKEIPLLQKQIDLLMAKAQQEYNPSKEESV